MFMVTNNAPTHINDLLPSTVERIDRNTDWAQWPLVRRNQAITARNRNMQMICEMLDMEYQEMPLEAA
jgi:hypothetical protein